MKYSMIITLLFALIWLFGGSCTSEEPYETYTNRTGISKFSFEYPARFSLDTTKKISSPEVDLLLHFWAQDFGLNPDAANILVSADQLFDGDDSITIESAISEYLAYFTRLYPDLEVTDQKTISIAGTRGEELTYIYVSPASISEDTKFITHVVFFQQSDIQFKISLFDQISNKKMIEDEFTRIIKSFEFLE